jgi:lysophospholipase L1-like esterase
MKTTARPLVLSTLLAACAVISPIAPTPFAEASARYTALGDSFAAGPLISEPLSPFGCFRSGDNYAHVTARRLNLTLRDVSCTGARTWAMRKPQDVFPDGPNPPQFRALHDGTRIVSVTIGGNDVGFSDILASCLTLDPGDEPCRQTWVHHGHDRIRARIGRTGAKVAAVLDGIQARAPHARIFLVNYPPIFPESGHGCPPRLPLTYVDVPYLRAREQQMNRMLASEAAAAGVHLVDWYSAGIGHDACADPSNRWIEPLLPSSLAAPVHPNASGMRGAAEVLAAAIGG